MNANDFQSGTLDDDSTASIPLIVGERYSLLVGFENSDFNSESITPKLSDGGSLKSALPTPGSADSSGSPVVFAANGMIEFVAALPVLELIPTGAVISVGWVLTRSDQLSEFGK